MDLRRVEATRYVTPLREGGSLPALVEASDDGLYVLKFRGAGQGPKALVAEIVAGELARALGLLVPELVLVELDPAIGRAEPDAEIQDLLVASAGLNLGVDFLPGALPFGPAAGPEPDPELAAAIVWFDALVTNVDRTAQNPNLLWWHERLRPIDHGAALYFHHASRPPPEHARGRFEAIADHVLLPFAGSIPTRPTPGSRRSSRPGCSPGSPPPCLPSGSTGTTPRSTWTTWPRAWPGRAPGSRRPSVSGSPFSYALYRVVPRLDRGERMNVGVVVFCRPLRYLAARTALDETRLGALWPDLDPAAVRPQRPRSGASRRATPGQARSRSST